MAASTTFPPLSSYSTALVILPPSHIQARINPFRAANDKSFPRWTSHITLVFPFVEPPSLPIACSRIRNALLKANILPFTFTLDKVDVFKQRVYDTVYLGSSQAQGIHRVWEVASSAVGYSGRPFIPHLTLGQAHHRPHSLPFLRGKGKLFLAQPMQWDVCSIVVLHKSESDGGLMEIYEELSLSLDIPPSPGVVITGLQPATYYFSSTSWVPSPPAMPLKLPTALTFATYNVLYDAHHPTKTRFPALLSTILAVQPAPNVICLQEVTDELLQHLLADPRIQARWPCCTHDPNSVLPNERNIVFLACEDLRFSWETVYLRSHKPAVILRIPLNGAEPLIVAGIHLTAGLEPVQRCMKLDELDVLLAFLQQRYATSSWILLGDFNIPTSQPLPTSFVDSFYDAWLTVHGSKGTTYDPASNSLAAQTAKEDRSPQRYDRIWVRRAMGMSIQAAEMFGQAEDGASDHYGLTGSVCFADINRGQHSKAPAVSEHHEVRGIIGLESSTSDEEVEKIVRYEGGSPTAAQQTDRNLVIATIRAALSPPARSNIDPQPSNPASSFIHPQSAVRFEFVPVGSFGLGVDTQDSDVDILVVGNISPQTFWTLARSLLRKSASSSISDDNSAGKYPSSRILLKRFVKGTRVSMMALQVGNVCVDMQYCSAVRLLESWHQVQNLPSTDPVFLLPAPSLRTLNAYRDMLSILHVLPTSSLVAFRLAHRALKLFCISHGIYSSRLGYLGGIHITLLLTRVTLLSSPNSLAQSLIRTFFAMYADWDWERYPVTIPRVNDDSAAYIRAESREPMVILSIEKPVLNVVQNANKPTMNTISSTFKSTHRLLNEGRSWADVCGHGGVSGSVFKTGFLCCHGSYIKLDLLFWGSSATKARAWFSYVESRLPHLLVLLQTSLPGWNVRLWPARLADANNLEEPSRVLQNFYLLGFDAPKKSNSNETIQALLLAFEDSLRRNERFYDSTEMFVSLSKVGPSQLSKAIMIPPTWLDGEIDPDEDTSDDEHAAELLDEASDSNTTFSPISSKQVKKNRRQRLRGSSAPHIPAPKLRTSSDVYHRLIWDRELDAEDYLIGYVDRFSGLKEVHLTSWKRDVEHEDFVPFHRVIHFRRKSDGVLVWDRRQKIDFVFGSGVQQTAA